MDIQILLQSTQNTFYVNPLSQQPEYVSLWLEIYIYMK